MNYFSLPWSRVSLGVRLGLAFGSIAIFLSVVLSGTAGSLAEQRIEQHIGYELTQLAQHMSSEIDRNMFERYREIQIIAGLKPFSDYKTPNSERRVLLNTLQATYPNYSWIGFADPQGNVQVSTQRILEGKSVAKRDWFIQGQQKPYVGDIHDAVLLAKLLPNPSGEPLRFVDVSTPVYDLQGDFQGVLGAHLSWQWIKDLGTSLLETSATESTKILLLDRLDTVLLGPDAIQGKTLNLESLHLANAQQKQSHVIEQWRDGQPYLVGGSKTQGYRSYPGLGWTVLVEVPKAIALSPASTLFWKTFAGGVLLGGIFAIMGWIAANSITQPLLQIVKTADQIRQGSRDVTLPRVEGKDEIARLSRALTQLIDNIFERERELSAANSNLRKQLTARQRMGRSLRRTQEQLKQIVSGIEDSLLLREVGTGKLIYSNGNFAKLYGYTEVDDSYPEDFLQYVYPDDRPWLAEKLAYEKHGKVFFNDEYRILDGQGSVRWLWDRSFPIRDETGYIYRYVIIQRDITALKRFTDILQTLMEGTAAVTGRAFFQKLVQHLATALDADHVFISEQVGENLQTLAFWSRGQLQSNITYSPDNTPCSVILENGVYYCHAQVAQEFPGNPYLVQLQAESYAGIALTDAAGNALGTLCIVSEKPLCDRTHYLTILQIFAHRAAAELERQRSETALQESEARFRLLAENVKDLVCLHNMSGQFLYLSPSCQTLLGYKPEELVGSNPYYYCHPNERTLMRLELQQAMQSGCSSPLIYRLRHKDGSYIWLESLIKVVQAPDGRTMYLQSSSRDITERVRVQQQLQYDATHDSLTGLPNRSLLLERLDLARKRAKNYENFQFAVLFIDLNRFKIVNDSLGHFMGDRLLQTVAHKLESIIRDVDLAARIGGDEFVLLLEGLPGLQAAIRVAEQVLSSLQTVPLPENYQAVLGASIGIVLGNSNYDESFDLLRDADIAMYSAKRQGKSCYAIFNQEMHQQALKQLELENDLSQALRRQELTLRYQPIISLKTGQLAGFEALVRWQHPEKGFVSPADFIPIAEETGLIVPLGTWVLQEACQQMARWQRQFPAAAALKISVNLSVQQLKEASVTTQIEQILQRSGLSAQSLALEITESIFMEDIEAINDRLKQLNSLGIQISIDDFGTGFSSLSYLHRLSVNNLKIDRSFVSNMFESRRNLSVTETIIKLSEQLGLEAIAEGIETPEQLQQLKAFGCNMGQGYLFNSPATKEAAETLILQSSIVS